MDTWTKCLEVIIQPLPEAVYKNLYWVQNYINRLIKKKKKIQELFYKFSGREPAEQCRVLVL